MSGQSNKAREALMEAAEELFAIHGIDGVSNRRITEHAGTANHSAIKYHFGTRDDLLNALIQRVFAEARDFRESLQASTGPEDGLRAIVTSRVLPWVNYLAAQPLPAHRAQFLFQARSHPELPEIGAEMLREDILEGDMIGRTRVELEGIPTAVLQARTGILGHLLLGICAQYERRINEGTQESNWRAVGYFLIDAIVGMLGAPNTAESEFLDFDMSFIR